MNPEDLLNKFEDLFDFYTENARHEITEETKFKITLQLYELRQAISYNLTEITDMFTMKFFDDDSMAQVSNPNMNFIFFGDFHGSLTDFIHVRNIFWKDRTNFENNHFVFLGDYVDRGIHGFEIIIYLILMKLLFPQTFTVLRGNHDVKTMNETSFLIECQIKFGTEVGNKLWTLANICFSMFPYCALINGENFCCHGGIPTPIKKLSRICRLPKLVENNSSKLSCQILWNDFYSPKDYPEGSVPDYYKYNNLRHIAYVVGQKAVDEFGRMHGIKRIFRAHQYPVVSEHGYDITLNNKVITLFSNSNYERITEGHRETPINNTACARLFPDKSIEIVSLVHVSEPIFNSSEDYERKELVDFKYSASI